MKVHKIDGTNRRYEMTNGDIVSFDDLKEYLNNRKTKPVSKPKPKKRKKTVRSNEWD